MSIFHIECRFLVICSDRIPYFVFASVVRIVLSCPVCIFVSGLYFHVRFADIACTNHSLLSLSSCTPHVALLTAPIPLPPFRLQCSPFCGLQLPQDPPMESPSSIFIQMMSIRTLKLWDRKIQLQLWKTFHLKEEESRKLQLWSKYFLAIFVLRYFRSGNFKTVVFATSQFAMIVS